MIELKDITYNYPDGSRGVSQLSLSLPVGKKTALLGNNGAGKSTLMLLLNGILKPKNGIYHLNNKEVSYSKKALRELKETIGIVFQEPAHQIFAPTVFEEVAFGPANMKLSKNDIKERVESTLEACDISDLAKHPPHLLSYGQMKMVTIASVLAMKPKLLILDEPTASLDARHSKKLINLINKANTEGTTILLSTHDTNLAYEWADNVVVMDEGKCVAEGTPKDIFTQTKLLEQLELAIPYIIQFHQQLEIKANQPPKNINELINLMK